MKVIRSASAWIAMLAICATVSCNKIDDYLPNHKKDAKHASVYVMSNDAGGNHILIYDQKSNGTLSYSAAVATGGSGAGGGIGSQGAIALSDNGKWLYTVNAGSNSISAFSIAADGNLELKQQIDAGGEMPVSLDSYGKLLYVVNGSSSICGFKIGADGMLQKIPGSVQMLSQPMTGPAQVSFAHNGHRLVVTEKATNMISNFLIDASGAAGPASSAPAEAQTPFGFSVQHANQLVVTDAFGGGSGASEVTSYRLHPDGSLQRLDRLATGETAACWIALDAQQRFGLITNTGSNNISSIHIDEAGNLSLIDASAVATGMGPIDLVISKDDKYVYVLSQKSAELNQYRILGNGKLKAIGTISGLPAAATGIVMQ